jgi:hypothetical protein
MYVHGTLIFLFQLCTDASCGITPALPRKLGDTNPSAVANPPPPQLAMLPSELTAGTTHRASKDGGGVAFVHSSCGGHPRRGEELSR